MAKGERLHQNINECGKNILRAMDFFLPTHTYLTSMEYEFILKFMDRTSGNFYSDGGK